MAKKNKAPAADAPAPTADAPAEAPAKTITCLCFVNPKRPGTKSYDRFALYATHTTVESYVEACIAQGQSRRNATADIGWDKKHKFIAVS